MFKKEEKIKLDKTKVIERMKQAKSYGLNYSQLADEIGVKAVTIYRFVGGNYNMSKAKQIQAMCFIQKYIEETQKQIKILKESVKWTT